MPSDDPRGGPPRRYSDTEVSRLLKHATELQEKDQTGGRLVDEGGITLATLQDVAAEAGIDPRYVRVAAARVDGRKSSGILSTLVGTRLLIRAEQAMPGELPERGLGEVGEEIEVATDVHGTASVAGRTLTWQSDRSDFWIRALKITVASRNGETRIQAREELDIYAVTLFGSVVGIGGVVGIGVGLGVGAVLGSALFATLFPVGLIGGLYAAMRKVMKSIGRERQARLEELVDRIARYARPGDRLPGPGDR